MGPWNMPPTVCPTPDGTPARVPDAYPSPPPAPDAPGRLRRIAVPAGVFAAVAGAFAYVGAVDPNEGGHYPFPPPESAVRLGAGPLKRPRRPSPMPR
ncbi:hypothetical protein SCALM49S_09033 [Streptomyces californicus]